MSIRDEWLRCESWRRRALRVVSCGVVLLAFGAAACGSAPDGMLASFPAAPVQHAAPGKILFVLSAASEQTLSDGSKRATGTFLGEFYEPYVALQQQGYQLQLATVGAAQVAIDPESLKDKY